MKILKQYQSSEVLEEYLGNPDIPNEVMSFKNSIDLDEREEFPRASLRLLQQWGMTQYYIPTELGGKLSSYEECFSLIRIIARRDLSVAVSDMHTFLGALPVWLEGTPFQKQKLAEFLKNGGTACLAVSEKAHGSDLLATETCGIKHLEGYSLSGEKWPINKATYTDMLTVLAKTDERGSPRSLSMFVVYKGELNPTTYINLPKIKTLGLRSSDISGIAFNNSLLPQESLIGEQGIGLDITLKGFFVTRTLCSFLSLGAADTALRTTLNLTLSRKLYNRTVFSLSHPRTVLNNAFLDIIICECVSISAARALHLVPEQFSVWSAIVKSFVPKRVERLIDELAVILGARYYFREEHDWGIFQKVLRDNGIISVFDGSSIVNLYGLILQLPQLIKTYHKTDYHNDEHLRIRLGKIFSLDHPLPAFDGKQLSLYSRGNNDALQGWKLALTQLKELRGTGTADAQVLKDLIILTEALMEELSHWELKASQLIPNRNHDESFEAFELAKKYCIFHAAATCLQMWLYNRSKLALFFERGEWLVLCLHYLLKNFQPNREQMPVFYQDRVTEELVRCHETNQLFSIIPLQLARVKCSV